jgi:O-antigen biosynthesis protein
MSTLVSHRIVITVPVYNEGLYIEQTLTSLAEQRFRDFKVLLSDNASTDETGNICRSFCETDSRFVYFRHETNIGSAANFRFCLEATSSDYFMWLGGHDQLHPEFLELASAELDANEHVSLVYGHTQWINESGTVLGYSNGGNYVFAEPLESSDRYIRLLNSLDRCEAINQLIRRKFIDFRIEPVISGDLVWLCHLAGHGPFRRLEKPLYLRREFAKRETTAIQRFVGKNIQADYSGLRDAFIDDIRHHRGLRSESKDALAGQVLQWMHRRFGVPFPVSTPVSSAPTGTDVFFSVVMPVYNRERYVREAINSVLAQDDGDFELIVVDDGSTDRSVEIIRSIQDPRIRLLQNDHGGGASARNTGIGAARGEFIVWIDSDDRQARGALAAQRRIIMQNPDADVVYGDLEIFDDVRHPNKVFRTNYPDYQGQSLLPILIQGNCLPNPGTAVRRSLYAKYGGYDVNFRRCHDYQMWTRLADSACFKKVEAIVCHWRQHDESLSSAKTKAFEAQVVLDAFARYPVSRLFPELAAEQNAQAQARWKVTQTLQALGEYSTALRSGYRARALGLEVSSELAELEHLAGAGHEPLFSIILTTYNRPELLKDALASVGQQSLRDFETILVNDNGVVIEPLLANYDFPITYVRQGRNQGPAAARNAAIRLARGQYVVYLDDDDRYLPEHLQVLAEALDAHPDLVVYTDAVFILEKIEDGNRVELGREQRYPHDEYSQDRLLVNNYIPVNTFACPRTLALDVGDFDESLAGLEDWDFLMRLCARSEFHHIQRETVEVRSGDPSKRSRTIRHSIVSCIRAIPI